MRDLYELPINWDSSSTSLKAVTCAEMDHWAATYGQPLVRGWARTIRRRSSAGDRLLGNPFIVVDLPPDPTTRKVFTPANPAEVWF